MTNRATRLDEYYVATIIDAIKNRRAAVMIGSGFSKNANNGHLMPNWTELAAYLECSSTKNVTSTSDILELAEMYVAVNGRSELDRILLEKTGNKALNVTPSELYVDFLNIPWVDIFTTNYDTLLEDAAKEFRRKIEYEFKEIYDINDIAFSKSNGKTRIVKLHGSFPSHRPFIITEEDYRTYENKFAPFVNTVQQSMLENIFCLIGFSSNDPNFKHWIGWVRDNLGVHQPKIYLITASDISEETQKYLDKKNIHVVNICYLSPEGDTSNKHYSALKEFFKKIRTELASRNSSEWKILLKSDSINRWDDYHNTRKQYPGWIIPPLNYISQLWWHFNLRNQDIEKKFNIKNFMNFYDMIWLMDKATYPLHYYKETMKFFLESIIMLFNNSKELQSQVSHFIQQNYNKTLTFQNVTQSILKKWEDFNIIFIKYLFATQSSDDFQEWTDHNLDFIEKNQLLRIHDTIKYYKILFLLAEYDNEKAQIQLSKWKIKSSDALLKIKKALLHNELGDYKKCIDILEKCKNEVDDIKLNNNNFHYITSLRSLINFYYSIFRKIDIDILSYENSSQEEKEAQKAQLEHEVAKSLSSYDIRKFFQDATQVLDSALTFKYNEEYFTFENHLPIVEKRKTLYNGYPPFYFAFCVWSRFNDLLNFASKIGDIPYDPKAKSNIIKLEILSANLISSQNFASIVRCANTSLFKKESILFTRTYLKLLTNKQKENLLLYLCRNIEGFIVNSNNSRGDEINFSFEFLGRLCFLLNVEQRESVLELAVRLLISSNINFFYQEKFLLFFKLTLQCQDISVLSKNIDKLFSIPVIIIHSEVFDLFKILSEMPIGSELILLDDDAVKYAKLTIEKMHECISAEPRQQSVKPTGIIYENSELQKKLNDINANESRDIHICKHYYYIDRLIWIVEHTKNKVLNKEFILNNINILCKIISLYNFEQWKILKFNPDFVKYKRDFLKKLPEYSLQNIYLSLNYPSEYSKEIFFDQDELKQILARLKELEISSVDNSCYYLAYILSKFFCNNRELLRDSKEWIEQWINLKSDNTPVYQLELIRLLIYKDTNFDNFIYQLEEALRSENLTYIYDSCRTLWCWRFLCKDIDKPKEIETMLLKAARDCTDNRSIILLNLICDQVKQYGLSEKELNLLYIVLNKKFIILNDDSLNIDQSETLENILRSKCSFPQKRYYCAKLIYELVLYAWKYDKVEITEADIVNKWLGLMEKEPFADTKNLYIMTNRLLENIITKRSQGRQI